jgi:hypothetical protein
MDLMERDDKVARAEPAEKPAQPAGFGLPRPSPTLTALTTSALALPGIVNPVRADAPIERATSSASFSYYFEDSLSPADFDDQTGDRERYEVYTVQARADVPVSDRVDVGVDFLWEKMSGASPWFVTARGGQVRQVMSGATIEDRRVDMTADVDFFMDTGKDTFSLGFSNEKDFLSIHGGIGAERNYNDKNTVLNVSGAFAYNWIDPTDAELFPSIRPESEENWTIDLFGGVSQILTRSSTVQFTINYKHSDGYLSDPYKAITDVFQSAILSDERPGTKDQASFLLRYRQHIEPVNASAHADYRLYVDDWGVVSHTVEAAWYQRFLEYFTLVPTLRWYSQSKADFYETVLPADTASNNPARERSSDFRLSPYGAFSVRGKIEAEFVDVLGYNPPAWLEAIGVTEGLDLIASLSYERYISDGDFSIVSVSERDEAPGLVNFHVIAITLSGRF